MANPFDDPNAPQPAGQEGLFGEILDAPSPSAPPPTGGGPRSYFKASVRAAGQGLVSATAGAVSGALEGPAGAGFVTPKRDLMVLYKNDPAGYDKMWKSWLYAPQRLEEEYADKATATMGDLTPGGQQVAGQSYNPFSSKPYVGVEKVAGDILQSGVQTAATGLTVAAAAARGPRAGAIGGAVEGGFEGMQTRQQVRQELDAAPLAAWQNVPQYQALVRDNWHPEMARRKLVEDIARQAGNNVALLSGVIAASGGALLGHTGQGSVLRRVAVGGASELPVEALQSGAQQIEQNLAIKETIDPKRNPFEDVPEQMWAGGTVGALQGGGFNAALGRRNAAVAAKVIAVPTEGPGPVTPNNPGNIIDGKGGFKVYATPEDGVAALLNNVKSYPAAFNGGEAMALWDDSINGDVARLASIKRLRGIPLAPDEQATLAKLDRTIAGRWAPYDGGITNPQQWAQAVAKIGGVPGSQPLDFTDPRIAAGFVRGVHGIEKGPGAAFTDDVYARGAERSGAGIAPSAVEPVPASVRALSDPDTEMLADGHLKVDPLDVQRSARQREQTSTSDVLDMLDKVREPGADTIRNREVPTQQLPPAAAALIRQVDSGSAPSASTLIRAREFVASNGINLSPDSSVSDVAAALKEISQQPAAPQQALEQTVNDPLSLLDTGMSTDEMATRQSTPNPNHRVKRENRPVQFGPAEAVGKPIREANLEPGQVITAAIPFEGASHQYMGAVHDTVQKLITQFAPTARVILTHESQGDAVASQRNLGDGWYHVNPRGLVRESTIGAGKYNATTQLKSAYSLAHEIGHVVVDQEFMRGLSDVQQAAIETLPATGYFEESFLRGLPADQQSILREYNQVKQSLIDNPKATAKDFILRWLSPWKTAHGFDQAKIPSEGWKRYADTPGRGVSSRMSARQFAEALSITHPNILGVHEYLAEQFSRYAYKKSLVEQTALGQTGWFRETLDKLRAMFKAAKLDKLVAPMQNFEKWLQQLPDTAKQPAKRVRREAVPIEMLAADHEGATRFDDPDSIALRDKLLFDETLANDLGTEIIRQFPNGLELPRRLFHGTGAAIKKFDLKRSTVGLYGRGIYLTDRGETASDYATRAGSRRDQANLPVTNVDDLEQYFKPGNIVPSYYGTDKVISFQKLSMGRFSVTVQSTAGGYQPVRTHSTTPTYAQFDEVVGNKPAPNVTFARADIHKPFRIDEYTSREDLQAVIDSVRKTEDNHAGDRFAADMASRLESDDVTGDELYKGLVKLAGDKEEANQILKNAGFDAITHIGGKITGSPAHRVWVVFDPSKISTGVDVTTPPAKLEAARKEALELLAHGQSETAKEIIERAIGKPSIIRWDGDVPGFAESDSVMQAIDKMPGARSATRTYMATGMRMLNELTQMFMDVRQMAAMNPHVAGLRQIAQTLTNTESYRGMLETKSTEIGMRWAGLNKVQAGRLANFMEKEYSSGKHIVPMVLQNEVLQHTKNEEFAKAAKEAGLNEPTAELFIDIKNEYLLRNKLLQKYMRDKLLVMRDMNPERSAYYNARMQALAQAFDEIRATPFHPQTRFGQFVLEVRKPGESQPFHVETFETAEKRDNAQEKIDRYSRDNKLGLRTDGTIHDSLQAVMRVLPAQVLDSIGIGGTLTTKQRRELIQSLDLVTRGQQTRKYSPTLGSITGASKEHLRVYADFMHNDALMLSKLAFRQDFVDGLNSIKDVIHQANLAKDFETRTQLESILKFSSKAVKQALNPAAEFHAARSFVVMHDLWAVPKSAVANVNSLNNAWAGITKRLGTIQGTAVFSSAAGRVVADRMGQLMEKVLHAPTEGWSRVYNENERWAMEKLGREGHVDETAAAQLAGWANAGNLSRLGMSRGTKLIDTVMRFGMLPFKIVEQYTRRVAFLSMFDAYVSQGENREIAYSHALEDMHLTQGDNSILNRAEMMRGKKSIATIYFNYTRSQTFLMAGGQAKHRRLSEARGERPPSKGVANETVRLWLAYGLMGGLMGLPGAEDLDKLVELVAKQLGYRVSIREAAYELARDVVDAAPDLGLGVTPRNIMHGLTTNIPLPGGGSVDLSSSMSLGNVVPGMGGIDKLGGKAEDQFLTGLLGPLGRRAQEFMNLFQESQPWEKRYALVIPSALGNVIKAAQDTPRFYSGGRIMVDPRTGEVKDLTTGETIFQAMGFAPSDVAARQELHYMQKEFGDYWMSRRNLLLAQVWEARLQKNQDAIHDTLQAVRDFNSSVPAAGLRITSETLSSSMKHRQQGAQRDERGLPAVTGLRPGYRQLQDTVLGR